MPIDGKDREKIERIQRKIREALESEGITDAEIEAVQVDSLGVVEEVGERAAMSLAESRAGELARSIGKGAQFDSIAEQFAKVERDHAGTTEGQRCLAAIDKMSGPLRGLFAQGLDQKRATALVEATITEADAELILGLMYELPSAVELLGKLQGFLAKRLAIRFTSEVTGKAVTDEDLAAFAALKLARMASEQKAVSEALRKGGSGAHLN